MNRMLYIVSGMGPDAVGLVGAITRPIASVNGNIVDMRQDVLHGLFTITMLVDLASAVVTVKEFRALVEKISLETGLRLVVERFTPVARSVSNKEMLVTLVGKDRPGIIAAITEKLGDYTVNIEMSDVVAREEIFLMDLLCDISRCTLPVENLKPALRQTMQELGITTMFQTEDVFNKKKKIVLFDISITFFDAVALKEVMAHTSLARDLVVRPAGKESDVEYMHKTVTLLNGVPLSVLDTLIEHTQISPGTHELVQALKIMGYRIGLITNAWDVFAEAIKQRLGLDYAHGCDLPVDEDAQTIDGDIPAGLLKPLDRKALVEDILRKEGVDADCVAVIGDRDAGFAGTPGIRIRIDTKVILDLVNRHVLGRESLRGILRSFGIVEESLLAG